ncbi:short-chain collagen C4-like [Saccostrea cucullata]|uniref:short-chain collagen C4-like n=1 Tax=Saccostrea cuccullata TaxID=36930 RepID=UPI002ED677E6
MDQISTLNFALLFLTIFQNVSSNYSEKRILLTDPTFLDQRLSNLEHKIQTLESENHNLEQEVQNLKGRLNQLETTNKGGDGTVYVLWGKHSCPSNVSVTIYSGYAAGGWWNYQGAPPNYLCLPDDPVSSGKTFSGGSVNYVYGVEYETNFWKVHSSNEDAPCAVCASLSGSKMVMIPGRSSCYSGWTMQYHGYLGANYYDYKSSSEYVCVDHDPDFLNGGERGTDGALFYPVLYQCGALQCPPYTGNEVVNCVVCTK